MEIKMVRLETLSKEQIQRLHQIVKPRIDPRTGKQARTSKGKLRWKNGSRAAEEFGVTRQTIANWLEIYPVEPERQARVKPMKPKRVQQFEKTEAWSFIKNDRFHVRIKNTLIQAWEYLENIDPVTWDIKHYKALRKPAHKGKENPLYLHLTGDIAPEHATNIRRFLDLSRPPNKDEFIEIMKDVPKRPAGARKEWYLETQDIFNLIQAITRLDVLLFFMVDLESGARPIALAGGKTSRGRQLPQNLWYTLNCIDKDRNIIKRWENKKRKWARAKHQIEHIILLERYIADMGIKPDEMIFPMLPQTYSNYLSDYGKEAGIALFKRKGSGAYVCRHTFATQALNHNVSIESVMEQGGWITPDVLMKYYAGLKESKLDQEFLDMKPKDELTWKEWISQFTPYFKNQYDKIIRIYLQERKKKKEPEDKSKRPLNWGSIKAWIESPKTKEHTKDVYKKALELHNKGLSDEQVREIMGWR